MSLLHLIGDPVVPVRQHHVYLGFEPDSDEEDLTDLVLPLRTARNVRRLISSPYYRHVKASGQTNKGITSVKADKDQFQVRLDVQQFHPKEITVKASGNNSITVEGKHEERPDEHGSIYRHFVRRYVLPKGHDIEKVESRLSSDGVLTITAPKIDKNNQQVREIPVIQTKKPTLVVDSSQSKTEKEIIKENNK